MAGYSIDPYTGEMIPAPDGVPTPTPGASLNGVGGQSNLLGSSVGVNQPYGPQLPHYGPWHAGGSPSGPIIPNGFAMSAGVPLQQHSINPALNPGTAPVPPLNITPAPPAPPPRPLGQPQAPQAPYGSPWDPQGAGYARLAPTSPNMNYAALGDQIMGGPLVQRALSALAGNQPQGPNSPFTMVMRPNAPANSGGRGGGGTPLGTALDLSGYRPPPPPAPPSFNLGYGAPGVTPAPARARAQAPAPFNPLTAVGPHGWKDNPGLGWAASVPRSGGRLSPTGVGVTEFMGP